MDPLFTHRTHSILRTGQKRSVWKIDTVGPIARAPSCRVKAPEPWAA